MNYNPSPFWGRLVGVFAIVYLTKKARYLRKKSTMAERFLWNHLKMKQLKGLKFRRQHPLGAYIVDFVCLQVKIIIELDGGHHLDNASDLKRDKWLESKGFKIIRFWNHEVFNNIEGVIEELYNTLP